MKAHIVLPCNRENPAYKPPKVVPGDAASLTAWMLYKYRVPFEIPALDTEIDDPQAWVHCVPDSQGRIFAEPIDDDCREMVAGWARTMAPLDKKRLENFQAQREIHHREIARLAALKSEPAADAEIIVQETEESNG